MEGRKAAYLLNLQIVEKTEHWAGAQETTARCGLSYYLFPLSNPVMVSEKREKPK